MAGAFTGKPWRGSAWRRPNLPNDCDWHRIPHLERNCVTVESELIAIMRTREEQDPHPGSIRLWIEVNLRSSCFAVPDKRSILSPKHFHSRDRFYPVLRLWEAKGVSQEWH